MSYYICPACGSSVDAGEHCSCGTSQKPTIQAMSKKEHKRVHESNGLRLAVKIHDEYNELNSEIMHQQAIQTAVHIKHREGIYKKICEKTESQ